MSVFPCSPIGRAFRFTWLALGCGSLLAGISHCGDKKKETRSDPSPVVQDLPSDWTGTDDWSGSPWTLEDE
jgi:hypothetical protein